MKLTVGKCWQAQDGHLVFQASLYESSLNNYSQRENSREKGYLILQVRRGNAEVIFSQDKPQDLLPASSIAMLIRKHLTTGVVTNIAGHADGSPMEFLRMTIQGKSNQEEPSSIFIVLTTAPNPEINIVKATKSIARIHGGKSYSVPKPAPVEVIDAQNLPDSALNLWLGSIGDTAEPKLNEQPKDPSPKSIQQKSARDRVARRLRTLKKTALKDEQHIPDQELIAELSTKAKFLQQYLWLVKPGDFRLELDSTHTGRDSITIEIDPDLSPGANLERYFQRLHKRERGITLGAPRLAKLKQSIAAFESALETLSSPAALAPIEINSILVDLGLEAAPPSGTTTKTPQNYSAATPKKTVHGRKFTSAHGVVMIVGRTADESDRLVKSSPSQAWWVHVAGGGHGGHVIFVMPKGIVDDSSLFKITREAGILALHFSDRSAAKEGDVYVARRHQIKKKKGMPPGLWQVDRASTTRIRYTENDLSTIFAREIRDGLQRNQAQTGPIDPQK